VSQLVAVTYHRRGNGVRLPQIGFCWHQSFRGRYRWQHLWTFSHEDLQTATPVDPYSVCKGSSWVFSCDNAQYFWRTGQ